MPTKEVHPLFAVIMKYIEATEIFSSHCELSPDVRELLFSFRENVSQLKLKANNDTFWARPEFYEPDLLAIWSVLAKLLKATCTIDSNPPSFLASFQGNTLKSKVDPSDITSCSDSATTYQWGTLQMADYLRLHHRLMRLEHEDPFSLKNNAPFHYAQHLYQLKQLYRYFLQDSSSPLNFSYYAHQSAIGNNVSSEWSAYQKIWQNSMDPIKRSYAQVFLTAQWQEALDNRQLLENYCLSVADEQKLLQEMKVAFIFYRQAVRDGLLKISPETREEASDCALLITAREQMTKISYQRPQTIRKWVEVISYLDHVKQCLERPVLDLNSPLAEEMNYVYRKTQLQLGISDEFPIVKR